LAARLLLSCGAFALALFIIGAGRKGAAAAEAGLYGTFVFSFLSTVVFAAGFGRVRRPDRFVALQLASDVLVVSALVLFTGGTASIFSFLFLPVTVYGALLFSGRGAYFGACGASLGYLAALVGAGAPLIYPWAVLSAVLLLVAALSRLLARELEVAGQALHRSRKDLGNLRHLHERTVESLTSGLFTTDAEGRVSSMNGEAERITGFSRHELLGEELAKEIPAFRLDESHRAMEEDGRGRRMRVLYRTREGEEKHLGMAHSILRDAEGEPRGAVWIFQDVTQVVAMEHELRQSERLAAAGQLSAHLAHEIRNPLAAISGSIQMLRAGNSDPGEDDRLMGIALREIERLDQLLGDFLAYARPSRTAPSAVRVDRIIDDVMQLFASRDGEAIELSSECDPDLWVLADPAQLHQVLWNLMLNAAAAMEEGGGRLTVGARRVFGDAPQGTVEKDRNDDEKEGWVELTVSDTGVGIAGDALERLFDPFFTSRPNGSGLGLATVHRIVEAHGGRVRVESRVGVGTHFRVRLPAGEGEPR
jgi:two-component system sensor histidine kinase PilS (NtrC family)